VVWGGFEAAPERDWQLASALICVSALEEKTEVRNLQVAFNAGPMAVYATFLELEGDQILENGRSDGPGMFGFYFLFETEFDRVG